MHALRIAVAVVLLAVSACDDEKPNEHPEEHAEHEAAQKQAEAECVALFEKVTSCRDDLLLLARTGPVLRGDPPEFAFAGSSKVERMLAGDLQSQCAKGIPAGLEKGVECYDDDCRKVATCMMANVAYPPAASGDDALECRDGLPAFEATGQGKVLQWCVMPDGTPHGLYRVKGADGSVLAEGTYDRGKARVTTLPGKKWWD